MDANKEIWFFQNPSYQLIADVQYQVKQLRPPKRQKGHSNIFLNFAFNIQNSRDLFQRIFFVPRLSQQTKQKRNVKIFPMTLKIQTICSHTKTKRNFQKLEPIWCKWRKKGQILLCGIFCKWETPLSQIMCSEKPKMVHIFVLRLVNWTHVN